MSSIVDNKHDVLVALSDLGEEQAFSALFDFFYKHEQLNGHSKMYLADDLSNTLDEMVSEDFITKKQIKHEKGTFSLTTKGRYFVDP